MKSVFFILILFLFKNDCCAQWSSMTSGYDSLSKAGIINSIKLKPKGEKPTLKKIETRLNDSTVFIKVYFGIFDSYGYSYDKNPLDFIEYNSCYTWIVYNDTVIASCKQNPDSTFTCGDSFTKEMYNTIKSIVHKIDLSKVAILQVGNGELYICDKKKLFVVRGDKLIEFNAYYKSKYTLKEFLSKY